MTIETIVKSKRKGKAFVNFTDESFSSLHLNIDVILAFNLKKGLTLQESLFTQIVSAQSLIDAKRSAYSFATYKPRSEYEVRNKLKEKKFDNETIEKCITFLYEFKLLDDKQFAVTFSKSYLLRKPSGLSRIRQELKLKGLSETIIESTIVNLNTSSNQLEEALKAGDKKLRILKDKPKDKQKSSMISFLQARGFSWDIIKQVLINYEL